MKKSRAYRIIEEQIEDMEKKMKDANLEGLTHTAHFFDGQRIAFYFALVLITNITEIDDDEAAVD